jgi:hypothetical protein
MNEKRKLHLPSDRNKLHALCDRLEAEIAMRKERLEKVRKLAEEADNAAIINTAKIYNITPEEFVRMAEALRSNSPGPKVEPQEIVVDKPEETKEEKDGSFELEETEDE